MASAKLEFTSEKNWKHAAYIIVPTIILAMLIPAIYPAIGSASLTIETGLVMVLAIGLSSIVIIHLKGNVLVESFIGGALTVGITALIFGFLGFAFTGVIAVLFVSNFIAIALVKKITKGKV